MDLQHANRQLIKSAVYFDSWTLLEEAARSVEAPVPRMTVICRIEQGC